MTVPRDRTTLRRRLVGLFQDWRWDGTWSLHTIPTDGRAPLFGDDDAQCQRHRRVITDMITEGFPETDVHFVNLEDSATPPERCPPAAGSRPAGHRGSPTTLFQR